MADRVGRRVTRTVGSGAGGSSVEQPVRRDWHCNGTGNCLGSTVNEKLPEQTGGAGSEGGKYPHRCGDRDLFQKTCSIEGKDIDKRKCFWYTSAAIGNEHTKARGREVVQHLLGSARAAPRADMGFFVSGPGFQLHCIH